MDWQVPDWPSAEGLTGNRVSLVPLDAEIHGPPLFKAFAAAPDSIWTYMSFGPFSEVGDLVVTLDGRDGIWDSRWHSLVSAYRPG